MKRCLIFNMRDFFFSVLEICLKVAMVGTIFLNLVAFLSEKEDLYNMFGQINPLLLMIFFGINLWCVVSKVTQKD